ncbi:pilus assembly PilX N-terminal domain-containing protein [Cellulomonas sp. URHD0024]|uniref:pilus assembly PilX family protein n=1 Tax=Cellulomonas sp. URHD0024 TaxID=1302620 RepID=UPI000485E00C|nr:pilus assembly PilX N-terminal domain-containing protein [Cellulomonas sp. URHD0024]
MRTPPARRGVLRRIRRTDDSGSVLILVIGSMLVLSMLALASISVTMRSTKFARYDQDYSTSMSAAQTGIDDFISRLNRDDSYGTKVDCLNKAWQGPMSPTSNICGYTMTTLPGWAPVEPGSTSTKRGWYHYKITYTVGSDTYGVSVTGRANGRYRTVEGTIKVGTSLDYVYYTDFEDADPGNTLLAKYAPTATNPLGGAPTDECGKSGAGVAYYWHYMPLHGGIRDTDTDCQEIRFASGDVLDGEVFSNDTIWATHNDASKAKPTFKKQVWTADENCKNATGVVSTWVATCLRQAPADSVVSDADFSGKKPLYHAPLYLTDTSAGLSSKPGCKYFGAVRIRFDAPASATAPGMMTVWNRTSVNNGVAPVPTPSLAGVMPSCGTLAALESSSGASIPVPDGMVVYAADSGATSRPCYAGELRGPGGSTLPSGNYTGTAPSGSTSTMLADKVMLSPSKRCNLGNIYVEGVLKGALTLAAAQSIMVTGDIVMAGGTLAGTDVLGLVATNSVEVLHSTVGTVESQKKCTTYSAGVCTVYSSTLWEWKSTTKSGTDTDAVALTRYKEPGAGVYTPAQGVQVAAAIQTLQHSLMVQSYDSGCFKGTLLVNGSIAQRWRGIVGVPDSGCATATKYHGYLKDYRYDVRLVSLPVPFFPKWANSVYTLRSSGEIDTPVAIKQ